MDMVKYLPSWWEPSFWLWLVDFSLKEDNRFTADIAWRSFTQFFSVFFQFIYIFTKMLY